MDNPIQAVSVKRIGIGHYEHGELPSTVPFSNSLFRRLANESKVGTGPLGMSGHPSKHHMTFGFVSKYYERFASQSDKSFRRVCLPGS